MWEGENEEGFVSSSLKSGHHILFRVLFALPSLIRGGLTASRRPLYDPLLLDGDHHRHECCGMTVTYVMTWEFERLNYQKS